MRTWWTYAVLASSLVLCAPLQARAEREVGWQLDPAGFPSGVSVLVGVMDDGKYRTNLTKADFSIGVDEYVGDQGGWIRNDREPVPGQGGSQILLVVDVSRTYTGELRQAKRALTRFVEQLEPTLDRVALATTPSDDIDSDAALVVPFTSDADSLREAIGALSPLGRADDDTARICHALADGLRFFPQVRTRRFRALVYFSAGIDRGEGRGECLRHASERGNVPFFMVTFGADRRYRDARSDHRLENRLEEMAERTGGRAIFRRQPGDYDRFLDDIWARVRAQYQLTVDFPCFRPAPVAEHRATLKVQGRDAEPVTFQAPSILAPTPTITAISPAKVTRDEVERGEAELVIEGTGFCGAATQVRAYVGDRPISVKRLTPYRLVATLNENVESGVIRVDNRFGQSGTSAAKLDVLEPAPGVEASHTLTALVILLVALSLGAFLFFALRARRAKRTTLTKQTSADGGSAEAAETQKIGAGSGDSADPSATVKMAPIRRAWVRRADGSMVILEEGINLIGRDERCRIRLDVAGISREHAKLELLSIHGIIWAEDLGSTNGTFWSRESEDGAELKPIRERLRLEDGDLLSIGGEIMTIHMES